MPGGAEGGGARAPVGARAELVAAFRRALRSGRLAHAYLLLGPPGTGKHELALELAAMIVCHRTGAGGCGCLACTLPQEGLREGRHPDVRVLAAPEGKASIPVEQVREELVRPVQLRPFSGGRQVYVIEAAHRLATEAQNTTLKTLEEPGHGIHLLLVADSRSAILPTVRSRCHAIFVPPRRPAESDPGDETVAAARAGALAWLLDPATALTLVDVIVPPGATTSLESQEQVALHLDELAAVLRDAVVVATGSESPLFRPAVPRPEIEAVARGLGMEGLSRGLEAVFQAKRAVQSYVDPNLATLRLAGRLVDAAARSGS